MSFEQFLKENLQYYFINKMDCQALKYLLKFKTIILIFKTKNFNFKVISTYLLIFEFLIFKPLNYKKEILIFKKFNLILQIKKGVPIGFKIILSKKLMFYFLKKLILCLILLKKYYIFSKNNSIITFNLLNFAHFFCFKPFYSLFSNIKCLNIKILTTKLNFYKKKSKYFKKKLFF